MIHTLINVAFQNIKQPMNKILSLFCLISILGMSGVMGQTNYVTWNFATSVTSANYSTNTTNQAGARSTALSNVTLSNITLNGTGISGTNANTFHRTTGWTTAASVDNTKYLEFSITLNSSQTFQNSTLNLAIAALVSSTSAAARNYSVYYGWGASPSFSIISGSNAANATPTSGGTVTTLTASATTNNATIPAPGNTTTSLLTIRISAYNSGTGTGNIQLSSLALTAASAPLTGTTDYYWNGNGGSPLSADFNTGPWSTSAGTSAALTWPASGATNVANFSNAQGGTVTMPTTFNTTPSNVVLGSAGYTFSTAASTPSILSSTINLGANALTLSPNATSAALTLSGIISGTGGSLNNNTGTSILSNTNTFTGGVTLTSGQLNINNAAALGTGTFTINGGTIDNTSGSAINTSTNNNAQTWGGDYSFTGSSAFNLGTGAVSLSASRQVTVNASTLTVGGIISGNTFSLTKAGSGALALGGVNTFNGGLTINAGTLQMITGTNRLASSTAVSLANIAGVTFDLNSFSQTIGSLSGGGTTGGNVSLGSATLTTGGANTSTSFGGIISGTSGILIKTGSGALALSGANTHTGGTTLSAGTLNINNAAALGTGTFTISGGVIDNTSGSAINSSTNNNAQSWGGDFTFTGTNALNLGTGAVSLSASRQVTVNASALTVGGIISGNTFGLTKAGSGTLTLSGANTYTGGTTLSAGTLNINNAAALGTGTFTINGGTIDNTSGSAINTSTNNNAQTWGGDFTFTGTNDLNLGTGNVTLTANRQVTVSANTLTVGGIISGGFKLTKAGNGTLALQAVNSYTGGTDINAGTISINGGNRLGATSGLLTINNATLQLITTTLSSGRNIAFAHANSTIDVASIIGYVNTTGVFSGSGVINKTGAGALVFQTSNGSAQTYNGLNIKGGTVSIGKETDLGTVPASTTPNYLLLDNGTLLDSNSITIDSKRGIVIGTGGGTINVLSTKTLAYGGVIADNTSAGSLIKSGGGVLTLNGSANSYTGNTTITAGELNLAPSSNATFVSQIILNGGTLSTTSIPSSVTFTSSSTLNLNANSTLALGSNAHTLTFAASNGVTWAGATLTITGWSGTAGASGSAGKIFVGSDATGLTAGQLAKISFSGYVGAAAILSTGEIVPEAISTPTISITGTLSALSTTYGTASSTTTFSVSGVSLTNDIVITPPSGFEVSTSIGSGYTTSLTLTQSAGNVSSTTVYVRLAASTGFGSYSGNIDASSTGATSKTVATVSSSVAKKALTITGISINNKAYDGTTTATTSGTAAYSGLVNSESFSVSDVVTFAFATASVGSGKTINQTGTYTVPSTNYSITQPTFTANISSATPPTITAAVGATVDGSFNVTFTDDAIWRSGISSITVGGTTLSASAYATNTAGQITFTPSASTLLQSSGSKSIVIVSTGYTNASASQTIGVGAASKLTNNTAPAAPATNGAVLATQPKVNITDQYGNIITTDNSTVVTVAATQGTWTLGGTLTATAANGLATFSGLTATSAAAVTGASLDYTATGLTGFTSATFNIPAPTPANDLCSGATAITVGASATSGTNVNATKSSPTTFTAFSNYTSTATNPDVWYSFTPTCSGSHTITVTPSGFDVVMAVFTGGTCPDPTYTTNKDVNGSGVAETHTFTVTAGTTYRVMVFGFSGATGTFTIGVSTAVNSTLTLANTSTPATGNIASGTSNATLFGFGLTPTACNNIDISSVSISTSGTAISSDVSNFRLLYDANSNGTADAGEISSPIGTVSSISNPLVFSGLTGQAFTASTVRRYLLIADIASNPSSGATFTASLSNANVTSTASVTGSAAGNTQTIITSTLVLANNTQVTATNILRGTTNNIIYKAQITAGGAQNSTVSLMRFVTTASSGGYNQTDIETNGFKLYRSTTNDFSTASIVGSGISSGKSLSNTTENLDFTTSQTLVTGNTYYYWLTVDVFSAATLSRTMVVSAMTTSNITAAAGNAISGSTSASGTQTFIAPTLAISENTAVVAGNVFVSSTNNIIARAQLAITNTNVTITEIKYVTAANASGYTSADMATSGFKLWINNTNNFATASQYGSSQSSGKNSANSQETITFTNTQSLTSGSTYYIWLTADISASATTGRLINVNGLTASSITSTTLGVDETGSTAASGTQTIAVPTVTLANTGTPVAGNIATGATNQIIFGFALTPNASVDLTSVNMQTTGTVTSSDLSNFRLIYDANSDGAASAGEITASLGTVSTLSAILSFSGITGQTGFSSIRRYLLIADVSSNATSGRTFTGSMSNTDITTTATSNTGSAAGNAMTLINIPAAGEIVINQFNPGYSGATDEFIELVNTTGKTFDLSLLSIAYASSSGGSGSAGGTLSGTLQPYSFWLLSTNASITIGGTSSLSRDGAITTGFAAASGQLALILNSNSTKIDGIGYGSLSGGTYFETASAGSISSNSGFRRNVDGTDNNNNTSDFSSVTTSTIYLRNSSSRLVKTGVNVPAATYRDLSVVGSASLSGNVVLTGQLLISNSSTLTLGTNNNLTYASISGSSASNNIAVVASNNVSVTGGGGSIFFNSSNNTLRNLSISGTGTTTLGNALNITGGTTFGLVTVGSGSTLTTGGNLTLKSDVNGTAAIGNSAGTISGNITVERFMSQSGRRWRYISSPVTGQTLANWGTKFYITGPGTPGATVGSQNSNGYATTRSNLLGFNNADGTPSSVRIYNRTTAGSIENGWANPASNMTTSLTPGLGFRAFVRGPITGNYATDTAVIGYFTPGAPPTQSSFTFTQTGGVSNGVNAGSVSMPINSTGTGAAGAFNASTDGWNLIGNPYPCAFDWVAFWAAGTNRTNIGTAIHVFDATANSYKSYSTQAGSGTLTSGIIPSGSAFFVQATGTGASLTFTEAFKTSSAPIALHKKGAASDELHIKYYRDSTESDEYILKMMNDATLQKDDYDIIKLKNDNLNLSSYGADSINLTLSSIPVVTEEKRISLNVEATQRGTYKFDFTTINDFDNSVPVSLLDKFTQKTIDIRKNPVYTFVMDSMPHQWGKDRFVLILNANSTTTGIANESNITNIRMAVYPNPASDVLNISINNASFKNSSISIFNISGNEVMSASMNGASTQLNIESLSNGVYFVKVKNENGFDRTVKFIK